MSENNEQLNNEQADASFKVANEATTGEVEGILKISLKTFYYCVVLIAFLISLFYTVFPYRALLMYSDLNMNERAFYSAKRYISMNEENYKTTEPKFDSKYADALLACVNMSISLMNSSKDQYGVQHERTQYFAREVVLAVDSYLSFSTMNERTERINAYNRDNVPKSMQVYFYSFEMDMLRARAKALTYTGDMATVFSEILIATNSMTAEEHSPDVRTIEDMVKSFYIIAEVIGCQLEMVDYFKVETLGSGLPDINKLRDASLPLSGESFNFLYSRSGYTPFPNDEDAITYFGATPIFRRITTHIEAYKKYLTELDLGTGRDLMLRKLYYTKALTDMTMNFYRFMHLAYKVYPFVYNENTSNANYNYIMNDKTYTFWDNIKMFDIISGGKKNPIEFFNYELVNYINT